MEEVSTEETGKMTKLYSLYPCGMIERKLVGYYFYTCITRNGYKLLTPVPSDMGDQHRDDHLS